MTRQKWTIGLIAAAFSVSLTPALWAQDTRSGPQSSGSRPSNGATTGSAAPRGGGSTGGSSGGATSSSSGSSSTSGMGSSGGFSGGMTGYSPARERAPERPAAERRGSGTGERATPRGSSAASGGESTRGAGGSNTMYYGGETSRDRAPIPAYSRPRDGRTVTGTPGERVGRPGGGGGGCVGRDCGGYYPIYDPYYYYGYYDPFYYGYGYRYSNYWMPGYGFGFGYFGYDPFLFGGYYDPYTTVYGGGQSSGGYGVGQYKGVGSLRLKVKPTNAQVYIDGYYVGLVDSFDGMFQKLEIEAGSHRIEIKAEGFEPVQFDAMVQPGETVTYKGDLPRIK